MDYNQNNNLLYNNYTSKNPSKRSYRTQPYNFFQSPPSQTSSRAPNSNNPYKNINPNYTSNNFPKYNNQKQYQDIYSSHSKNSLKWRNIMKINLPQLKVSGDLNMIESNLDNLINADVSEEDMQSIPESNIVKLIDILQTTSNILMNEREEMEGEINKLENENIQIINEFKMKEKNDIKNKDLLRKLKKEKQRDLGVLNSYQNVINNLKNGNFYNLKQINTNISDINIGNRNIENVNLNSNRLGEFKCPHCQDKNFKTEFELHKHLNEVHKIDNGQNQNIQQNQMLQPQINIQLPPNYYDSTNNDNNGEELLKKMDEMNRQMKETFVKFTEEKKKEEEEVKLLNNNGNNFYQQGLDRLEKTFNETLNDFKLIMEKNNENKNENVIIQNNDIDDELYNNRKNEEIRRLKQELENIQNKINEQDLNYENEIKKLESNVNTLNIEIMETKKIKEDEMNISINKSRNPNMNVSINRQFSIETKPAYARENKQNVNLKENISDNKEKGKKKKYINEEEFINKLIDEKLKEINIIKEKEKEKLLQNQSNKMQNKKDIKPEISQVEEDSESYINTIKNKLNIKKEVGQKKNTILEKYYKRYIKRDKNYIDIPNFDNYFIQTLPDNFEDNEQINLKYDNIVKDKVKNVGEELFPNNMNIMPKIEEGQLKGENIENLTILINSLMNTMDKKNINKNGEPDDYYLSIKEVLGLDNINKIVKDISTKLNQELKMENINTDNKDLNKQKNNGEIKESQMMEEILNKNDNESKANKINNSLNQNEIKNGGIILNDIQDIEINNENPDNQNNKFRNKQKDSNNKQGNFINNINTNISDPNNNPIKVLIETVDISQRKSPINSNDPNKDVSYTSTQAQINVPVINSNDPNKDVPYTSTQAQIKTSVINNNDPNKDLPYTSTQTNISALNHNNNAPYNNDGKAQSIITQFPSQ